MHEFDKNEYCPRKDGQMDELKNLGLTIVLFGVLRSIFSFTLQYGPLSINTKYIFQLTLYFCTPGKFCRLLDIIKEYKKLLSGNLVQ